MKTVTYVVLMAVMVTAALDAPSQAQSQGQSMIKQFREAYKKERGKDLDGAIKAYQEIVANTDANRRHVSEAQYRLGMCYLKTKDKDKGIEEFQRLISDFSQDFPQDTPKDISPVERAKQQLKNLGVEVTSDKPSKGLSQNNGLERVTKVLTAQLKKVSVADRYGAKRTRLLLSVKLPQKAIAMTQGEVKKAVTSRGKDLIGEDSLANKIRSIKLAQDRQGCEFAVFLPIADKQEKALKELSGWFEYATATKSKQVDLGITSFEKGGKGKEFGAVIKSVWKHGGYSIIGLRTDVPEYAVKSARFYDAHGQELEVQKRGTSVEAGEVSINYATKAKLPTKGRIVLEVFENILKHKVSFTATNVSLKENESTLAVKPRRPLKRATPKAAGVSGHELSYDDGFRASKTEFISVHTHYVRFELPGKYTQLKVVRIYGIIPPSEKNKDKKLHVLVCNKDFKVIGDFPFTLAEYEPGYSGWVTLKIKPTKVPRSFAIGVKNDKMIAIGADTDGSGHSSFGTAGGKVYSFTGAGDWLIRAVVD